jgi:hypothetical protein
MVTLSIVFLAFILIAAVIIWLLRQVDWNTRLTEPTILAAIIAASAAVAVALSGAIGAVVAGWISASAERERTRATVLLGIVQQYEPSLVPQRNLDYQKTRTTILIQSGIISDDNRSICMALIKEGCPIKVLKAR